MNDDEEDHKQTDQTGLPYQNFGTDIGEDLPNCDHEIFESGEIVRVSPLPKASTERVVTALRQEGWRVDWHWESSRPVVKAIAGLEDILTIRRRFDALAIAEKTDIEAKIHSMTKRDARERRVIAPVPVPLPD